ncbi:hypothetical protein [Heyndrickxia acidicola]|uniref:Uncharacterized protein n=1 Tax=Heyndrickxia acidicola TaxID=209389 RepID=A0ABU6MLL8_9BACI|nr:hypothetical protein [Heyndrickxia acidicola]MED1205585.1 hypothetical protein [Heyndrickxia acidicola]
MKQTILTVSLGCLLIGSSLYGLAEHDIKVKERDRVIMLEKQVTSQKREIQALQGNDEKDLNRIANQFVVMYFSYAPGQVKKPAEMVINQTIGKAKAKLSQPTSKTENGEFGGIQKDLTSIVQIMDTQYNKTGNDSAVVRVKFQQELTMNNSKVKTINNIKLQLVYTEDGWKITDYQVEQTI